MTDIYRKTLVMPARGLEWQERGLCAGGDPAIWFPEKGEAAHKAKRICRMCPVRSECLEWAMDNNERFGIYGGMSERERRLLRQQRKNRKEVTGTLSVVIPLPAAAVSPVARALLAGHRRSNQSLADELGVAKATVRSHRVRLERANAIPVFRTSRRAHSAGPSAGYLLARRLLEADPSRPLCLVAREAGVSKATMTNVRRDLGMAPRKGGGRRAA